ncbi:vesicular-fusion protein SEC18 [Lentinula edodes]|uniref:Vesicular-fusion protein SEC18 n=1 Tax=Lentinula edodes TaxID=5353 RepID=A0A1Q3E176_LENED|nr:P-loop containing nucleoside triphosphate hydrolase protein [Lentinula edodes]KAH7876364.1 P-loop containing nucleoside triphosphate hydrolase protein [Lentinula edodes]KAJ3902204.1 vesicular-fusion protein SEC18 [Lentinula edodes]GAW01008.1 vesicular-fusion protein sec18 [Lentinula edodes]
MSFFNRGSTNTPPPSGSYGRLPPDAGLPSGPRGGMRPPPSMQYQAPPTPYNDPSSALFEKRGNYERKPVPRSGGSYGVVSSPSDQLALSNCLIVHPMDFQQGEHVLVKGEFALTVRHDNTGKLQPGTVGASALQRAWIGLSVQGDSVTVEPLPAPPNPSAPAFLQSIDVEVGFLRRGHEIAEQFSADDMVKHFLKLFNGNLRSVGETIVFEYHGQNLKGFVRAVSVLELAEEQRRGGGGGGGRAPQHMGILMDKTDVTFMKAPDSAIKIKSSAKKAPPNAILAPNFKFEDMGIGGLDTEFNEIFRRAFASRVFPPGLVEKLGIQHVKGILLHGPPGTGKTLIARQIGKMLNAREPKIVNGPEILNKYVGASEENIRKLFADAEKEYKEKGDESGLHIIIFDELDAIFKQRGSTNSGTGVGDTVVNQLLSKMDGVDQLNNILIIGMTNRKDMIDEALLRPGRLEVHMEISLPDEHGRLQILNIHTARMRTNGVMDDDVDLPEIASVTKNFSGAEIGGLIKSATSFAFNRHVKVGTMAGISDDVENLRVNRRDFMSALEEVHPAFGVSEEELLQVIQNGIIHFDPIIDEILRSGQLFVEQVRTSTRTPLVSVLLHGPAGSGKTALGASIAQASQFPFIKLISPDSMVGFSESQKVTAINKIFADSYKSPLSVIVVDNLERLLEWTPIGPRFSNAVLQTLLVLFARRPPKGRRLLVIATSSLRPVLTEIGLSEVFDSELRVPPISNLVALEYVIQEVELFSSSQERREAIRMLEDAGFASTEGDETSGRLHIGIKKLLSMIEMARQEPDNVAQRLTGALMGLGM